MKKGLDEIYSGIKDVESNIGRDMSNIFGRSTDHSGKSEIPDSNRIESSGLGEESRAESNIPGSLGLGGTTGIGDLLGIGSTGLAGNPGIASHLGGISGIMSAFEDSGSGRSHGLGSMIEKGIEEISGKLSGTSDLNQGSSGKIF